MKKLFCMADIHSFYELARDKLDEVGFDINNPNHIFVHCGDLLVILGMAGLALKRKRA